MIDLKNNLTTDDTNLLVVYQIGDDEDTEDYVGDKDAWALLGLIYVSLKGCLPAEIGVDAKSIENIISKGIAIDKIHEVDKESLEIIDVRYVLKGPVNIVSISND